MNTIVGKNGKGAIVTLVERKSSVMFMEKIDTGKQAIPLAHTVVYLLKELPVPIRTITTDNGSEFVGHEIIAGEVGTVVYFAHPCCSWKKGVIENMNGLIRQYIPKKTEFRGISKNTSRRLSKN
jgi:IS30 family transposase